MQSTLGRGHFAEALSAVASLFEKKLTKEQLSVFYGAVRHLSDEDFSAALTEHVMTSRWMPRPADILQILEVSAAEEALASWGFVMDAMRSLGRYRSVDFGPQANAAIEDLGGWVTLCGKGQRELDFARKDFLASFAAYASRGVPERRGQPLIGLEALDCQRIGAPAPTVHHIGAARAQCLPAPQARLQPRASQTIEGVVLSLDERRRR